MTFVAFAVVAPIVMLLGAVTFVILVAVAAHPVTGGDWRSSFLKASIITGVLVWLVSEGLGSLRLLNTRMLLGAWVAVAVGTAGIGLSRIRSRWPHSTLLPSSRTRMVTLAGWSTGTKWCLVFMVVEVGALGVVAWAAAPNTWDSMTYHLSRVMHWQQNQDLSFYSTAIQRQLTFSPWAEMAMLQFQVLTNTDRLANVVQYFSFLGCAIGASYVAKRLGADRRGQVFAALTVIALPMAVLQSTSTQNDLAAAYWCIAAVAFAVERDSPEEPMGASAWLGAAIGLAALTKITALVFLTPLIALHALRSLFQRKSRASTSFGISALAVVFLLLPHSLRNLDLYGNPLGIAPGPELSGYTNEVVGIRPLISNLLRTQGLQLASPWTAANGTIERLIRAAHSAMRVSPSDPAITWRNSDFEVIFSMYEDNASNPAHWVLILAGLALLIRDRARPLLIAWFCWIAAFVLFSMIVKWQPWNGRLILPLLISGSTLAAVQLSRRLTGEWIFLPGLLLGAIALPYVLSNPTRPLIGARSVVVTDRMHQYFANVPDDLGSFAQAAVIIHGAGCAEIGLVSSPESREYLLWVTNQALTPDIRVEHVLVKNASRKLATDFSPCAVVVMTPFDESTISLNGNTFQERLNTERFHLFLPSPPQ